MSSPIWTRCAGNSRIRPFAARPWRVVEAQHLIATRRLVDSGEEQALLEALIDEGKPPLPPGIEARGLHVLLTTSFRYPPLRHGSRFAERGERSLWYGSDRLTTALAEVAYYRLVFLEGTRSAIEPVETELSAFRVRVRTRRGVDLTRPPFDRWESRISSPSRYRESQALGRAMREAGVEAFRYRSARDPLRGSNVALFTSRAFAPRRPDPPETWHTTAARAGVEFQRKDFFRRDVVTFERADFLVGGGLPQPAP